MPWCEECARYWSPASVRRGGECPTCGRVVEAPTARRAEGSASPPAAAEGRRADGGPAEGLPRAPWHFKVLLVALAIYLTYRLVQGVVWVAARL